MTGAGSFMSALKRNKLVKRNKQMSLPGIIPVNIEMKQKKKKNLNKSAHLSRIVNVERQGKLILQVYYREDLTSGRLCRLPL